MNETPLDRAKSTYRMAERNFQFILEDDNYLNLTGYLLQQSVELALKHVLEISGIKYPKTHSIGELIGLLSSEYSQSTNELMIMSGTITTWESKTRYIKNFRLSKRQLEEGFKVIGNFLDTLREPEKSIDELLKDYIDENEVGDFMASIPKNITVSKDNIEFLTSMYKQIRRK